MIGEKTFRKLKQFDLRGYKRVSTYKNGKGVNLAVHRLVLATFAPITGWEQMQVNHVDGNRGNNRIENLRWCTHDENAKHTLARGTQARGGNHGKSVFSDREATKLINYYRKHRPNNKFTLSEMARKFGVNRNTLKGLLFGRNWSHLKARADWLEARKP